MSVHDSSPSVLFHEIDIRRFQARRDSIAPHGLADVHRKVLIDDYDHLHVHNYAHHVFAFCSLRFDSWT